MPIAPTFLISPQRTGALSAIGRGTLGLACALMMAGAGHAQTASVNQSPAASVVTTTPPTASRPALEALPAVDLARYVGTWYQVALIPNKFQSQCVSDTSALYRALPGGQVEVTNRCRNASGAMEDALGQARPRGDLAGSVLSPAKLQVSFLPAWLRWMPVGWGDYWVIQLPSDYRYAVISEPRRKYLWVLSRSPQLSREDDAAIRASLISQGFDLSLLKAHPQAPVVGTP